MRYEVTLEGAHGNLIMSTYEAPSEDGEFWVTDIEGWYGGVGVENSDAQRKIGHGFLSAPARRSARTITLKGALNMPGMEAREIAARFISGLVWDGGLGSLTVATENGLVLTARVRLDGAPKTTLLGDSAVEFEVPLVAPDPFLKSPPHLSAIPSRYRHRAKIPALRARPFRCFILRRKTTTGRHHTAQGKRRRKPHLCCARRLGQRIQNNRRRPHHRIPLRYRSRKPRNHRLR